MTVPPEQQQPAALPPPAQEPPKRRARRKVEELSPTILASTPSEVAADIKRKVAAGQPPPPVVPPPPQWTPEGIGPLVCGIHNFVFSMRGYSELEPEEEKKLSETTAYYLNIRWPTGARYEPEYRLLAVLSGIWGPREMALQKRLAEEREVQGAMDKTITSGGAEA